MRAKQPISFKLANRGFLPAETTDLHKHIWNLAKIAQISSLQLPTLVSAQCPANRTKGSQGPQTRSRAGISQPFKADTDHITGVRKGKVLQVGLQPPEK